MTKKLYLERLENYLSQLSHDDVREILDDVTEHFNAGISNGRSEEEISVALGSPKEMAFNLISQYEIHTEKKYTVVDNLKYWATFISIGFSNLILLPLFFSIALLVGSLFVCIGAFKFAGILLVIAPILDIIAPSLVSADMPIILLPVIGILLIIASNKLNKKMLVGSRKLYQYALKFSKSHLFVINYLTQMKTKTSGCENA